MPILHNIILKMTSEKRYEQRISVFDMLKIGVGPSSSHTLGPWLASKKWVEALQNHTKINKVKVILYGSLAKTGKGHGTDIAIAMGLTGADPKTFDTSILNDTIDKLKQNKQLLLGGQPKITFDFSNDIIFNRKETLPYHSNAMKLQAFCDDILLDESIYYSVGGGFVVKHGQTVEGRETAKLPYPCNCTEDLLKHCLDNNLSIFEMVWANEQAWRTENQIEKDLFEIWEVIKHCVYKGCHTQGHLPGGLNVKRRAHSMHQQLLGQATDYKNVIEWFEILRALQLDFAKTLKWISCFAFAVNEENAAFGRVVTAPTNGAAGVIPAVLMYYICFCNKQATKKEVIQFLCIAAEIGTFFKKKATISAAMGGCQAEIGVSSAMAAAALTECMGGSVQQAMMAAEIAMEHHLGLTCDPIGGLVQVPCIERNSMGAIKAITAANIALSSDPASAKVSLDEVIETMWETAQDMHTKYKETSEGGLAIKVPVGLAEC